VPADPKSRSSWLARVEDSVHAQKRDRLLKVWRDAGLWLHSQGTLEDVLQMRAQDKGAPQAAAAAESTGALDDVATWSAYKLDSTGELELLLNVAIEELAHSVMTYERSNPGRPFHMPSGERGSAFARLATVEEIGGGVSRITVTAPEQFRGYWVEFSRDTPASALQLQPPTNGDEHSAA